MAQVGGQSIGLWLRVAPAGRAQSRPTSTSSCVQCQSPSTSSNPECQFMSDRYLYLGHFQPLGYIYRVADVCVRQRAWRRCDLHGMITHRRSTRRTGHVVASRLESGCLCVLSPMCRSSSHGGGHEVNSSRGCRTQAACRAQALKIQQWHAPTTAEHQHIHQCSMMTMLCSFPRGLQRYSPGGRDIMVCVGTQQ